MPEDLTPSQMREGSTRVLALDWALRTSSTGEQVQEILKRAETYRQWVRLAEKQNNG
jgi:hypothetical protein